jgi:hypothetical protein
LIASSLEKTKKEEQYVGGESSTAISPETCFLLAGLQEVTPLPKPTVSSSVNGDSRF